MIRNIIIFAIVFVVLIFVGVFWFWRRSVSLSIKELKIGEKNIKVEVANTPEARALGLSYRTDLPIDGGMLFIFDKPGNYPFWMKGMNFPIDIVWIRDNKVIGIEKNARPDRGIVPKVYSPSEPVNMVLELNALKAGEWNIKIGDEVLLK